MFDRLSQKMHARSAALLSSIDNSFHRILQCWLLLAGLAAAIRLAAAPIPRSDTGISTVAPYLLLVLTPFVSALLALRWFRDGDRQPQPQTRLAQLGRWRSLTDREARQHPFYGATGIMVSLVVGMMLNVPVRAVEFLAAIPPLPMSTPAWLSSLRFAMTLDVVLFSSLYMIAAVAALRRVPLFPRLLAAVWAADLAMQLFTAELVTRAGNLPPAVAGSLQDLLEGNVKKVLVSVAIWLPYLLLSKRVNVTYRNRVPA
jgi:hypothetical protein